MTWPKGKVARSYNVRRAWDGELTPAYIWLSCDVCGEPVQASTLNLKAERVLCLTHAHGTSCLGDRLAAYCERCTKRAKHPDRPRIATGVFAVSGESFGRSWTKLMSLCGPCGMEAHTWTYFAPCPECEGWRKSGATPGDPAWRRHLRSGSCKPIVGRYVTSCVLRASGSEVAALWLRARTLQEAEAERGR